MRTKDIADWLDISTATIRAWTSDQNIKRYLSPLAQGGDGTRRRISPMDARILAYVANLRDQQYSMARIATELDRLEADNWQGLPPMPQAPPGVDIDMMPREAAETALVEQRKALLREIKILQDRVSSLEQQLKEERDRYAQDIATEHERYARDISAERERQTAFQRELLEAREQLGELRGKLGTLTGERLIWLRGLILVTAVAIVLLVVVVLFALASGG